MLNENILRGGFRYNSGGWTYEHIGKNIWKIYPVVYPHYIVMDGTDLATELFIKFTHRLLRTHFFHTDGTYAANTDDLGVTIKRSTGTLQPQNFEEMLYDEDLINYSHVTLEFEPEMYDYEASLWTITLNSTSGNCIFPLIYIQNRGGVY